MASRKKLLKQVAWAEWCRKKYVFPLRFWHFTHNPFASSLQASNVMYLPNIQAMGHLFELTAVSHPLFLIFCSTAIFMELMNFDNGHFASAGSKLMLPFALTEMTIEPWWWDWSWLPNKKENLAGRGPTVSFSSSMETGHHGEYSWWHQRKPTCDWNSSCFLCCPVCFVFDQHLHLLHPMGAQSHGSCQESASIPRSLHHCHSGHPIFWIPLVNNQSNQPGCVMRSQASWLVASRKWTNGVASSARNNCHLNQPKKAIILDYLVLVGSIIQKRTYQWANASLLRRL